MSDVKNGGPAFPQGNGVGEVWVSEGGMTLRDYFAAKAMQGFMASDLIGKPEEFAEYSYQMADAMIKERDK